MEDEISTLVDDELVSAVEQNEKGSVDVEQQTPRKRPASVLSVRSSRIEDECEESREDSGIPGVEASGIDCGR